MQELILQETSSRKQSTIFKPYILFKRLDVCIEYDCTDRTVYTNYIKAFNVFRKVLLKLEKYMSSALY